jgi:hypothetical protein
LVRYNGHYTHIAQFSISKLRDMRKLDIWPVAVPAPRQGRHGALFGDADGRRCSRGGRWFVFIEHGQWWAVTLSSTFHIIGKNPLAAAGPDSQPLRRFMAELCNEGCRMIEGG